MAISKQATARRSTAHHEAAHAVAMHRFGFQCMHVSIRRSHADRSLGRAFNLNHWGQPGEDDATTERNDEEARNYVVMCLAGFAAERRLGMPKSTARRHASSDFDEAENVLPLLVPWTLEAALVEAKRFIRTSDNWRAVTFVARQLLTHKDLDDAELEAIIEIADGKASQGDLEQYRAARAAMTSARANRVQGRSVEGVTKGRK